MILIFFLCIKLSILHLCVSDLGYQCKEDDSSNNPEIVLIGDQRPRHDMNPDLYNNLPGELIKKSEIVKYYQNKLNDEFRRFCSDYYDITTVSIKDAKRHEYDNVIQFAVPDYYDGKPLKNFVYAGNISKTDDAVCNKTNKTEPKFDCNEVVNLVSKSVLHINDGHVYNFVQNMSIEKFKDEKSCEPFFPKTSELTTVLLCLREPGNKKQVNIQPLKLVQVIDSADCSIYSHKNLLAVLAPEPFGLPSEYSVPTIFYENPYLFSEYKTVFPNSMSLLPWQLLKYGFLLFIQTVGWQRVAIVIDDSEYSLEFEDELTALFNKERIIYTVIRCEDANCEMDKIAEELRRVSARIVIANVEEKNAEYLFQHTHLRITWLVRDMVGYRSNKYLPNNQVAYSFSLRIDAHAEECGVEGNILTGLSSIAQAYKYIANEDYKGKKLQFYRRFADILKQETPRITEATVVIHKLYGLQEISTMFVNATGATLLSFNNKNLYDIRLTTDGTAHCLLTSYDYHNPCEDPLVMFFMLTFMVFMLTFILIIRYFDKNSPFNDIRYQNF